MREALTGIPVSASLILSHFPNTAIGQELAGKYNHQVSYEYTDKIFWYSLAYFFFGFSARLPAWKKPGSDEVMRSPRMNPIRKEGVG